MSPDGLTQREQLADRLRRAFHQANGHTIAVLDWWQLQEPEQALWLLMADAAYAGVVALQDVDRLASPSG